MTDVSASDTTTIAWEHVYATSAPELRRWLDNSKPVAMHQDALMVAVPNNFTRNQLEGRFRPDIEQQLSDYFQRTVQLAVIVDSTVTPEPSRPEPTGTEPGRATEDRFDRDGFTPNGFTRDRAGQGDGPDLFDGPGRADDRSGGAGAGGSPPPTPARSGRQPDVGPRVG